MDEVKTQLPPVYRRIIECAEEMFPEASEKYCSEKEEGVCKITGGRCSLRSCPKIQKARGNTSRTG
ncbi:hypothetical protein AKJ41_00965 [candidate division MSBL1 archaeon SCGC-AAA259O05]|uniref:Uncharacterized protein n=1 Tax=candidate division MSBL1 archaeon SCGC-AAA259O05 TaxID=1698271 RepID=A0A133V585_9EURY|nr:hypothetical protein AKJ41_00965 [candidate division MSBL1 archaeon SCGC-AAA259O05]